jgi:signal transduction histidine kinase
MLMIPPFFLFLLGGFIQHALSGNVDLSNYRKRTGRLDSAQTLLLSRTIAENPRFWTVPETMARLSEGLDWAGSLAVFSGDRPLWISEGSNAAYVSIAVTEFLEKYPEYPKHGNLRSRGIRVSYAWDFVVPDMGMATFYFLVDFRRMLAQWRWPTLFFFTFIALVLAATNGLLTWMVSRSVLIPLRRLEERALRIRDGDLAPVRDTRARPGSKDSDEFDQVFRSFDEMRRRLKASLEQQEAMERNRLEMIASISHDLRTPLAAIKGYAEGLQDGVAETAEKKRAYIDTILGKSRFMERLIEDLFLLSRLRTADFPYDMRPIDLRVWLAEYIDELRPDYPGLSIRFAEIPPSPCVASIDPFRMGRVVTNIVQNAAAYTQADRGTLTVTLKIEAGSAVVRFADNGSGIPAEERERVFDYHYRSDQSRHREGSGLGLSIARLIAAGHGGSIRAEEARAEEGGGACLVLTLPLERP